MRTLHTFMALATLSLAGQQPRTADHSQPAPRSSSALQEGLAIRETFAVSQGGPQSKTMGLPSRSVVIEDFAVEILDPPTDVRFAKAHLKEVETRTNAALAFLDTQLKHSYQEQTKQLDAAKAAPETYREGIDSPLHKELWNLVHGAPLKEGEQGLVKCMQDQMEAQKTQAERDQHQLQIKTRMEARFPTSPYDWGQEDRHRYGALRNAIAWNGNEFLKGYRPSWEGYASKLDAYLQTSARLLMELQARSQPPSTQLLGRLLEIQVYERCRALIDLNTQIWRMSAAQVLEPKQWYLAQNRGENIITGSMNSTRIIPVL